MKVDEGKHSHTRQQNHGPVVDDFVAWCENAFLHLNITKTKDMSIDLRRHPNVPCSSVIKGQDIDMVPYYKYLGTLIDNRLKFGLNTASVCKRGQQRLFAFRKLAKFQMDKT